MKCSNCNEEFPSWKLKVVEEQMPNPETGLKTLWLCPQCYEEYRERHNRIRTPPRISFLSRIKIPQRREQ